MTDDAADNALIGLAARRLGMVSPSVKALSGGSRNRCYALEDGVRSVIVRINGEHDEEFAVARAAESLAQHCAAAGGLAPAILLDESDRGLLVMERAPGEPWTRDQARSPGSAAHLGGWLARLHRLPPPPGLRAVDFVASLEHYAALLEPAVAPPDLLERARAAWSRLHAQTREALCHNDLHHLNILGPPAQIAVIDWEYAGLGYPVMDLAGFVAYHELEGPALQALLDGYAAGARHPSALQLADARWLFEAVWWAWLALKSRLEGCETRETAAARRRLGGRLGLPVAAHRDGASF